MDRCEECKFVYGSVPVSAVSAELRSLPPRYAQALRAAERDGLARARPRAETWSALEYTCHVRDVLRIQRERLLLAMEQERPVFTSMRRDERAVEARYNEQDVDTVLEELEVVADRIGRTLDALEGHQWQRVGIYPWPQTAERSLAWVARNTLHEGVHHLEDIVAGADLLRAGR